MSAVDKPRASGNVPVRLGVERGWTCGLGHASFAGCVAFQRGVFSKAMSQKLLPTSLVGSYAQPDWLIDRNKLAGRFPPRTRASELWRVAPEHLAEAQDDATR